MSKTTGVISMGVKAPIIRQEDDLKEIVVNSVMNALDENGMKIQDGDVIGITESVVARAQGNYVTIDDIVQFLDEHKFPKNFILSSPIMSRNRFSMILKAFARYANEIVIETEGDFDEVGNPNHGINPFTGVDIMKYYEDICKSENCKFTEEADMDTEYYFIDCRCHPNTKGVLSLMNIMYEPVIRKDGTKSGYNYNWGLLGSNKANEETLKLFPRKDEAQELVDSIQKYFKDAYGVNVEVMIYGDGCFKSPDNQGVSIWEFADPVTTPAMTQGLRNKLPNEIKLKAFADDKYKHLNGEALENAIKNEIKENKGKTLVGNMTSQGTTPRQITDLLASLFDLCSGSGSKGTPIIITKNYFKDYSD